MKDWIKFVVKSDWDRTRRSEIDTNLFYKDGWNVRIIDVETIMQWLKYNVPFPVSVSRVEKYRNNFFRNPITISSEKENNLEEFLPLIKENFMTTHTEIIKESKNSFKVLVRKHLLFTSQSAVDNTIITDLLNKMSRGSFKSLKEFNEAHDIVNARYNDFPTPKNVEKANNLTGYPRTLVRKMMFGFWVSKESFEKWLNDQKKAYEIFRNIAY